MRRIDDYRECRLRTGREKLFGSAAAVAVACCVLSKDAGTTVFLLDVPSDGCASTQHKALLIER